MRLFCFLLVCSTLSAVEGGLYRISEDGAQPCDLLAADDTSTLSQFMAIGAAGGAFGQRMGGGKRRAIARHGGSRRSESAGQSSLRELSDSLDAEEALAVRHTALAALCWLGAGYDHKTPNRYREQIERVLTWLQAQPQDDHGLVGSDLATHAQLTCALAEAYGMTLDPALKQPAQSALDALIAQQHQEGWWPAAVGGTTADLQACAWAVMACTKATFGGLMVGTALDHASTWARTQLDAAEPGGDAKAIGRLLIMNVFIGRKGDATTAALIANRMGDLEPFLHTLSPEGRYFWMLSVFQVGGEHRRPFNTVARPILEAHVKQEPLQVDADGQADARDYYAILSLEIFYHYKRLSP